MRWTSSEQRSGGKDSIRMVLFLRRNKVCEWNRSSLASFASVVIISAMIQRRE